MSQRDEKRTEHEKADKHSFLSIRRNKRKGCWRRESRFAGPRCGGELLLHMTTAKPLGRSTSLWGIAGGRDKYLFFL